MTAQVRPPTAGWVVTPGLVVTGLAVTGLLVTGFVVVAGFAAALVAVVLLETAQALPFRAKPAAAAFVAFQCPRNPRWKVPPFAAMKPSLGSLVAVTAPPFWS